MLYGSIKSINKPVSRLVLGTMIINTRELEASFSLLDSAFEIGFTALDTAHVYAGGDSERAIGRWMKERDNRDKVVVITKGAHHNADRKRVTPFDITADLFDSLSRLQTDYIDIYMLHRDDPSVPVGPIVEILNTHHKEGRIHAFGGSNWRHERIQEANDYARVHGLVPFTVSSPNFGLAEQVKDPWGPGCVTISGPGETAAREWYERNGIPVFAYSSLARGFFSGRVTRENFQQIKDNIDAACLNAYCHECNFDRLDRVNLLAERKGVSVPQIALAYVLNHQINTYPLVGAANIDELRSNAEAFKLKFSPEEMAWLDLRI